MAWTKNRYIREVYKWKFLTIEKEINGKLIERGKRGNSNTKERKDSIIDSR
jgi:hypothetical protein